MLSRSLLSAALLAVALTACGKRSDSPRTISTQKSAPAPVSEPAGGGCEVEHDEDGWELECEGQPDVYLGGKPAPKAALTRKSATVVKKPSLYRRAVNKFKRSKK